MALLAFGTALRHSAPMELEMVFIAIWLVGVVCGLSLSACCGPTKDKRIIPAATPCAVIATYESGQVYHWHSACRHFKKSAENILEAECRIHKGSCETHRHSNTQASECNTVHAPLTGNHPQKCSGLVWSASGKMQQLPQMRLLRRRIGVL